MSSGEQPATVLVRGASLSGMAAAARLARAGHHVVLDADGLPDGGHWAARRQLGMVLDDLPQTFLLPASWRDLFKKSGRALDAELSAHRLAMVPAPDQLHRFADGREFALPTERGAQVHAVAAAFGHRAAEQWTALLDELDELWMALRGLGLERPVASARIERATRTAVLAHQTLDQLSERAGDPHLACIVRAQGTIAGAGPGPAPALLAARLAVHRRFGSWQLVDEQQQPQRASVLVDLLGERLDLRGVERTGGPGALLGSGLPDLSRIQGQGRDAAAQAELDALPRLSKGFAGRVLAGPALAPTVLHRVVEWQPAAGDGQQGGDGIRQVVDHSAGAPVLTWTRPLGDGSALEVVHDHDRPRPDLAWGLAPSSWNAWRHRQLLGGPTHWHASAASHAGNEPWQELLAAALAVYQVHEQLTGEDIRPSNKQQPRRRRQARPAVSR